MLNFLVSSHFAIWLWPIISFVDLPIWFRNTNVESWWFSYLSYDFPLVSWWKLPPVSLFEIPGAEWRLSSLPLTTWHGFLVGKKVLSYAAVHERTNGSPRTNHGEFSGLWWKYVSGWWLTYPEKYESQLGLFFPISGKTCSKPPTRGGYMWIYELLWLIMSRNQLASRAPPSKWTDVSRVWTLKLPKLATNMRIKRARNLHTLSLFLSWLW